MIRWLATAVVQRPELGTNRSVVSDPYSDPVTRYRTCGLSEKKTKFVKHSDMYWWVSIKSSKIK